MTDLDEILARGRAAAKRMAAARQGLREALAPLSHDERALLLAEYADEVMAAEMRPRPTLREVVTSMLHIAKTPVGAQSIFEMASSVYPDVKKASLDAEISAMKALGLVVEGGKNERGAALYVLPDTKAAPAIRNPDDTSVGLFLRGRGGRSMP